MNPLAPFPCPRTDAVLALHLDGDPAAADAGMHGYAFVDGEDLRAHLCACDRCRTTLRRARRLDAALAGDAGRALSEHQAAGGAAWPDLAARWFAALPTGHPAAAAPAPVRTRRQRHRWPLATAVAAAIVVAGALAWWPAEGAAAGPAAVASADITALPNAATPAAAREPAIAPLVPANDALARLRQHRLARAAAPPEAAPGQAPPLAPEQLAATLADPAKSPLDRVAATRALAAACDRWCPASDRAFAALVDALASCGDFGTTASTHGRQLAQVAGARGVRGSLASRLLQLDVPGRPIRHGDLAVVVVAARLGDDELDALLRRVVRRQPAAADVVAAALRCGVRTQGAGRLLLDVWRDLEACGEATPDVPAAPAWFLDQPATLLAEVAAELRSSRSGPRRLQCLLALGAADDGAALPTLLAVASSRHHDEAHAAAFALSCLPHAVLAPVVAAADADEAFLLRAALARAGHAAAQPWIAALALRPAERQRLRAVPLAQFPEVASWFRERSHASD